MLPWPCCGENHGCVPTSTQDGRCSALQSIRKKRSPSSKSFQVEKSGEGGGLGSRRQGGSPNFFLGGRGRGRGEGRGEGRHEAEGKVIDTHNSTDYQSVPSLIQALTPSPGNETHRPRRVSKGRPRLRPPSLNSRSEAAKATAHLKMDPHLHACSTLFCRL